MKRLFLSGITVLMLGAVLTGCSRNEDLYDANAVQALKQGQVDQLRQTYSDAFVKCYGQIAATQDWGFGRTSTTRGITRGAVADASKLTGYAMPKDAAYVGSFNNFTKYGQAIMQKFAKASSKDFLTIGDLVNIKHLNLENYYVQHVYKSTQNGKGKTKANTGAQHKDFEQLYAYNYNDKAYEVVTEFEKGKNNKVFYNDENQVVKGVTFMLNMGTPDESQEMMFAWGPKKGIDGKNGSDSNVRFSHYAILEIEGDYYIGFDYTNIWAKKEYDFTGDFTGWIVRLVEAEPVTTPPVLPVQARIFCEDMGDMGDFDFNDVVFDAVLKDNNDIDIKVLASGATYDISIDGVPVTIGKMTNTGEREAAVQSFTIKAVNGQPKYANLGDIPVVVNPGGDAVPYSLQAEVGQAPQKICTFVGVDWVDEYVSIERAYSGFKTWVNTATPDTWAANQDEILTDLDLTNN